MFLHEKKIKLKDFQIHSVLLVFYDISSMIKKSIGFQCLYCWVFFTSPVFITWISNTENVIVFQQEGIIAVLFTSPQESQSGLCGKGASR